MAGDSYHPIYSDEGGEFLAFSRYSAAGLGPTPLERRQRAAEIRFERQAPPSKKDRKYHRVGSPGRKKRLKVLERDDFRCVVCGFLGRAETLTVDHIRPVYFGGSNRFENLQTMCGPCNNAKGAEWDGVSGWPKAH